MSKNLSFKLDKKTYKDEKGEDREYQLLGIKYNGGRLQWMDQQATGGVTEGQGYALQHPLYLCENPTDEHGDVLEPTCEEKAVIEMYKELYEAANSWLYEHRAELIGKRAKIKTYNSWKEVEMVPPPVYWPKIKDGEIITDEIDTTRTPIVYTKLYMSKPKNGKESIIYTKYYDAIVLNEDFQGKDDDYRIEPDKLKNMQTKQISEVWIGDIYISADKIRWRQTIKEAYVSEVTLRESGAKKQAKKFVNRSGQQFGGVKMPEIIEDNVQDMNPDDSPPGSPDTQHYNKILVNGEEF